MRVLRSICTSVLEPCRNMRARALQRLYEGAAALDMRIGLSAEQLLGLVMQTVRANRMEGASGAYGLGPRGALLLCTLCTRQARTHSARCMAARACGEPLTHTARARSAPFQMVRAGVHIRLMVTRGLKPTPYQVQAAAAAAAAAVCHALAMVQLPPLP